MPLRKGRGQKVFQANTRELLGAYKRTGKIGNVVPKSAAHARRVALAIAFSTRKGSTQRQRRRGGR